MLQQFPQFENFAMLNKINNTSKYRNSSKFQSVLKLGARKSSTLLKVQEKQRNSHGFSSPSSRSLWQAAGLSKPNHSAFHSPLRKGRFRTLGSGLIRKQCSKAAPQPLSLPSHIHKVFSTAYLYVFSG